ncbi:hypothetical protein KO488_04795 [Poseidonibacter lekithochrous]|uniref:sulfotransferase family protein n=1 Tax=Poseidonibacter TaxID=2321187 RepID=UPI001C0A0AEB|nr:MULTISPECIES: hypothetical protein [Poseidonibacter]MBU3014064.1 hypothetical protein [Poseidonibacter lekithochrous]MDO6827361.1 hypothetical protein [Poseidonibacter sp. 1_MG-2023]
MKTAYFILGMHRSGASSLSGVLNIMGLDFGSNLMQGDKNNPKGYYENNFIYELNENILKENKSSWDDYNFNINEISIEKKEIYINNITKLLDNEFKYSENFVIKDPKICLLFPLWEEACSKQDINIKVILARKNPIEVAQSLKTKNNFSQEKSLLLWSKYFLNAEYLSRKYNRITIFFDDLIKKQDATIKELLSFTNFDIEDTTKKEIVQFLDKNIKHNISKDNLENDYNQRVLEIKALNKNIDELLNDLKKIQNDSEKVKKENSDLLIDIQNLNKAKKEFKNKCNLESEEVADLNKTINEILSDLEQIKESKQSIINNKTQEINDLKNKLSTQEDINIKLVQEIESLNKDIDEILKDFLSMKESKSWLYTKPIRKLQKSLRGK